MFCAWITRGCASLVAPLALESHLQNLVKVMVNIPSLSSHLGIKLICSKISYFDHWRTGSYGSIFSVNRYLASEEFGAQTYSVLI